MLKLGLYNSDELSDGVGAPVFRQFTTIAYNNVKPLTACLKKVEKENIIGAHTHLLVASVQFSTCSSFGLITYISDQ